MSLPPELPASRHLDTALDLEAPPQGSEHPMMLALAFASVIIAVAADLLTVIVFMGTISSLFSSRHCTCPIPDVQADTTGITNFLWIAATIAVIGAAGSLIIGILVRRRAARRAETSDVARLAAGGIRFSAPAVVAWGMVLCWYLFLAVTSSPVHP